MEQVLHMVPKKIQCWKLHNPELLRGLEGNAEEIVDGSAFKLYWKVCTKNGDWNEVAEVKMDWVSSFQPLLSVWKMWNESLGRNSLLSSKFEDDQAKQSWYAWAFDIHKGTKSFMKSPNLPSGTYTNSFTRFLNKYLERNCLLQKFWAVNSKMTKRNRTDMRGLLTSTKESNLLQNRHIWVLINTPTISRDFLTNLWDGTFFCVPPSPSKKLWPHCANVSKGPRSKALFLSF